MSQVQVYAGEKAKQFHQQLNCHEGWQTLSTPAVIFSHLSNTATDIGEQSGVFQTPDGQCLGVFSGKLFGFAELVRHLPPLLSTSEKLALLLQQLYARHGLKFPQQLSGFFVIVLWIDGQLLAVRDAIGERSLYYLRTEDGFIMADRLAALLAYPACTRQLDPGGVCDYLSTGFSAFSRTPVKGIRKLPAGTIVRFRNDVVQSGSYHQLRDQLETPSEADSIAQVRAALEKAVHERFETNVKTGLLLSGGLDSSAVGALLGKERLTAAYSLNFGDEYRHELEFSGLMAKHIGIPARVITVTSAMIKARFLQTANILDEPIGDPLTVPNIILAEAAAQEVQLVFNGEGGDPVFGGPKNLPIMAFEAYRGMMPQLSQADMYLRAYNKGHEFLPQLLSKAFQQQLQTYPGSAELLTPYLEDQSFHVYLHRLMHINLRLKGASQILPKVFKAASAAGIAVRSPLFYQALTELAFSLSPAMKLYGTIEKYVLKQAVSDIVPATIIARPKSGMLVPVQYWFTQELREFAREILLDPRAKTQNLLQRQALNELIDFKGGGVRPCYGDRLWLLLSLECWMQAHSITTGI